jgi:hypothetical protein
LSAQTATAKPSKSREQALQVKAILDEKGFVTKEELLKVNAKYPSDGIYYAKNLLKLEVIRKDGAYWTPAALAKHEEEKAKQESAKKTAPAATAASAPAPQSVA